MTHLLAFLLSILHTHPYLQDYHSFIHALLIHSVCICPTVVSLKFLSRGKKKKTQQPRFPGSCLVTESRPLSAVACFKTLWKDYLIQSANVSYHWGYVVNDTETCPQGLESAEGTSSPGSSPTVQGVTRRQRLGLFLSLPLRADQWQACRVDHRAERAVGVQNPQLKTLRLSAGSGWHLKGINQGFSTQHH